MKQVLKHQITAQTTPNEIVVYQAFNALIGKPAAERGTLNVPAFSKTRMTWIKPSFLWMMYRCGWGRKDEGQAVILKITLKRASFCELLGNACLSSFDPDIYEAKDAWSADLQARPNRVQWDPDKDIHLNPIERRAIQLGIAPTFVEPYLAGILTVEDITDPAQRIEALIKSGKIDEARAHLPEETPITEDWLQP